VRIALAPDSYKESLSAIEVADALERGVKRALPDSQTVKIPVADGGEGTVDALVRGTNGEFVDVSVTGPLGDPVSARYGFLGPLRQEAERQHSRTGRIAVIEMASASGLPLVPHARRNPLLTTTYGTGELIRSALDLGARKIIIGIGGSATVDGGAGMAEALGVRLLDAHGKPIPRGGGGLAQLAAIDTSSLDPRIRNIDIEAACDVQNPLAGPTGAAAVYGPQKGATPDMVRALDAHLARLAEVVQRDLGVPIAVLPGSGAAGGLGGGIVAFLAGRLRPGFDIVADTVQLDTRIRGCDLVVTGEGRLDGQAVFGKTPIGVARRAQRQGIPVVAIVGSLGPGCEETLRHGISAYFAITPGPMPLADAMRDTALLTERCAEQVVRLFASRV
jgi:glycerate 2-kinase